jgi:hypothetical protein
MQHWKIYTAISKNMYCNNKKYVLQPRKNMSCNIEKHVLQHRKTCTATSKKYLLQHRKLCAATSKVCTTTSQAVVLQHRKTYVATTQKSYCNIRKLSISNIKKLIATREEQQKKACKTAPDPSPSSSPKGGGNRTPELTGTLATAASLRSKGGVGGGGLRSRGGALRSRGGGGGLRSREGPTYLIGAATVVLVSGGGRGPWQPFGGGAMRN